MAAALADTSPAFLVKLQFILDAWGWTEQVYWCQAAGDQLFRGLMVQQTAMLRRAFLVPAAFLWSIEVAAISVATGLPLPAAQATAKNSGPILYEGVGYGMGNGGAYRTKTIPWGVTDPWQDLYCNVYSGQNWYRRGLWMRGIPAGYAPFDSTGNGALSPNYMPNTDVQAWINYIHNNGNGAVGVRTNPLSGSGGITTGAPPPSSGTSSVIGGSDTLIASAGLPGIASVATTPQLLNGGMFATRGRSKDPAATKPLQIVSISPAASPLCGTILQVRAPYVGNIGDKVHIGGVTGCAAKGLNGDTTVIAINNTNYEVTVSKQNCCCGTTAVLPTGYLTKIVYAMYDNFFPVPGVPVTPSKTGRRQTGKPGGLTPGRKRPKCKAGR